MLPLHVTPATNLEGRRRQYYEEGNQTRYSWMVAGNTCQDKMTPACSPPNTHTTPSNKSSFTHASFTKRQTETKQHLVQSGHNHSQASLRCCLLHTPPPAVVRLPREATVYSSPLYYTKSAVWSVCSNSAIQVPIPLWPLGTHSCCTTTTWPLN